MKSLRIIYWVCLVLLILGGLNWGLVAILNYDFIKIVFGDLPFVPQIIYGLIAMAALYIAVVSPLMIKRLRDF